jgi:hypothetical protein
MTVHRQQTRHQDLTIIRANEHFHDCSGGHFKIFPLYKVNVNEVPSIKLGHVIHLLLVHFLTDGDDSWKSNFDDDKKPFRFFGCFLLFIIFFFCNTLYKRLEASDNHTTYLSHWISKCIMVWVQIPSREEQKFDSSKIFLHDISCITVKVSAFLYVNEVPSIKLGHVIHLLSVHFLTDGDDSWKSNFDDDKKKS